MEKEIRDQMIVDLSATHAQCIIWTWNLRAACLQNDNDAIVECEMMLDALDDEIDYLEEQIGVEDE